MAKKKKKSAAQKAKASKKRANKKRVKKIQQSAAKARGDKKCETMQVCRDGKGRFTRK